MRVDGRERGAALLLVVGFLVVALIMVFTLVQVSVKDAEAEGEDHGGRVVQAALRAGIATSFNEVNRYVDLDDDGGIGSMGTGLGSNTKVYTSVLAADGSVEAEYRTTLSLESGVVTMLATAAFPSFAAPKRTAAAKLALTAQLPPGISGARSAFLADGSLGTGSITMSGTANMIVPDHDHPAVRISDLTFLDDFSLGFVGAGGYLEGDSVSNPGTVGTGTDSVENAGGGLVSAATLEAYEQGFRDWATDNAPGSGGTVAVAGDKANGTKFDTDINLNTEFPGVETFWLSSGNNMRLEGGATLSGSGTLIVNRNLQIDTGAALVWDGDVIVLGDGAHATLGIGGSPGTATINGNLFLLADSGKRANLQIDAGGSLTVTGAFNSLSRVGESEVQVTSIGSASGGGTLTVDGLFAMLGNKIDFRVRNGGELAINGMMVVATPTSDALQRFWVDSGGTLNATFDEPKLEVAVTDLTDALENTFELPAAAYGGYEISSYMELTFSTALTEQDATVAGATAAGLGIDALLDSGGTTPVDTTPVDTTPVDTTPVDTTPVDTTPVDPPAEPDPSSDPNWDATLGIILDSEALLSPGNACHCGTLDGARVYKYTDHHGKNF